MLASGMVGCSIQYFDPNKPASSPSHSAKITLRFGGSGKCVNAVAVSSTPASPLALSSAAVDLPDAAATVRRFAATHVIVMRRHQNVLILELRIASFDHSQQISRSSAKRLEVSAIHAGRFETQLLKLLHQITARRPTATATGFATFHGIVGQHVDEILGVIGRNHLHRRRHGTGIGRLGRRTLAGPKQSQQCSQRQCQFGGSSQKMAQVLGLVFESLVSIENLVTREPIRHRRRTKISDYRVFHRKDTLRIAQVNLAEQGGINKICEILWSGCLVVRCLVIRGY